MEAFENGGQAIKGREGTGEKKKKRGRNQKKL